MAWEMLEKQPRRVDKCFLAPFAMLSLLLYPDAFFSTWGLYKKKIYSKLIWQVLSGEGRGSGEKYSSNQMLEVKFTHFSLVVHFHPYSSPSSAKVNRIWMLRIYVRQGFIDTHLSYSIKATGKQGV